MSKYDPLWAAVAARGEESFWLSYEEIEKILGFAIDHSFLLCKKELAAYGFAVEKISMKEEKIFFVKLENQQNNTI